MQLDLRHIAEQNAKRYRENLSYLRGYEAAADEGRPLPAKFAEKAGWVWAVERVRADLRAKDPEKERFFAELYHLDRPISGHPGRGSEVMKLSLKLKNGGKTDITGIEVTDEVLGSVFSGQTVRAGETLTLEKEIRRLELGKD